MRDPASLNPPFEQELLADLHAGLLDAEDARLLWPRALADADAAAVLAALDSTTADLARLAVAVEPMPELVAARLQRSLLVEPALTATPVTAEPLTAEPRRTRRFSVLGATAAAAVVGAIVIFGVGQLGRAPTGPSPQAGPGLTAVSPTAVSPTGPAPAGDEEPLEVAPGGLSRDLVLTARGTPLQGRLADEGLRTDCLAANGYVNGVRVLGSRPVKVGARLGTLLLIPGDRPPLLIAIVVGDRCSASDPDLLAVNTVTG